VPDMSCHSQSHPNIKDTA